MENKKKKGMSVKLCATLLALAVVLGLGIGGTIAWLTAQTDPVVNTFTVGDVSIKLWEYRYDQSTNKLVSSTLADKRTTSNTYKIVPGMDMPKNPYVKGLDRSEPCWIFVKVEEKNFIEGLSYNINVIEYDVEDDGSLIYSRGEWTQLEGYDDVYYIELTPENYPYRFTDSGLVKPSTEFDVLSDNKIHVSGEITKEQLEAIDGDVELNFTAYAIQHEGFPTAEAAWKVIKDTYFSSTSTTTAE